MGDIAALPYYLISEKSLTSAIIAREPPLSQQPCLNESPLSRKPRNPFISKNLKVDPVAAFRNVQALTLFAGVVLLRHLLFCLSGSAFWVFSNQLGSLLLVHSSMAPTFFLCDYSEYSFANGFAFQHKNGPKIMSQSLIAFTNPSSNQLSRHWSFRNSDLLV